MWGYPYMANYTSPLWFVSPIFSFLIGLFIILLIVRIFTGHGRHERIIEHLKEKGFIQNETPIDILKKRYAKGEITKKEFDEMRADLS